MANRRPRSYTRAYSDEEDRYSDDFVSDDERHTPNNNGNNNKDRSTPRSYYQDRLRGKGRGLAAVSRGRGRGRGKGRGGGRSQHSRNSEPPDLRRSHDSVTQRVLSASRNKVNEFRNQVAELTLKMKELSEENKLYKKLQFRQEKALRTFEDKENDLPSILEKHANEVRTLKENNRRLREKYDKSDRYLRDAEDELERSNKKLKKYKEIVDEKDLKERDELSRKLTKAEIDMEEKDVKIKELQRHVDVLKKNHRHELGIEAARLRDMKKQIEELTENNAKLNTQLKESQRMNTAALRMMSVSDREAALEKTNIYANRAHEESLESPTRRIKKKTNSLTDLTPRDKAKFYADKKREEFKQQKALKEDQERKKREKWEQEEKEKQRRYEEEERERKKQEIPSPRKLDDFEPEKLTERTVTPPNFSFKSLDLGLETREKEERLRREEEDRKWRQREEEDRKAKEELEKQRKSNEAIHNLLAAFPFQEEELEKRQEDNRRREIEDRNRKEREEAERLEREARERKLREEREEKEKQERREMQEKQRREKEKFEQEKRAEQEKRKLENDPSIQEERRKKDELLRKLQAMDELGSAGTKPESDSNTSPVRFNSNSRGGSFGSDRERKEYSFTKPVNNLHKGKPSHEEKNSSLKSPEKPRNRRVIANNDDEDGGYNPSFAPTRASNNKKPPAASKPLSIFDDDEPMFKLSDNKPEKKPTNLLENLFGPQAGTNPNKETKKSRLEGDETFFVTSQRQSPVSKRGAGNTSTTTFPWDASPSKTSNQSQSNFSNESTLFGGGAAIIDDDFSPSRNRVLPRRQRQNNVNAFSSKPSVTAVDNFEDDIEEVVL